MNIYIETLPQANGRLLVATYEVNGLARRSVESVFIGLRAAVCRERTNRIDKWCHRASEVEANAVPGCRQ